MPYVITTTQRHLTRTRYLAEDSRRAVATLEEAREAARSIACGAGLPKGFGGYSRDVEVRIVEYGLICEAISALPESGGTVGPFPDGTTIDVKRIQWRTFAGELSPEERNAAGANRSRLIDAYNAKQAA